MEFSDYAETRDPATTAAGLIIPLSQGGSAKSITEDLLNPNRGDYNGSANAFPSTGGRFTAGVPMRGDRWRIVTTPLTIGGTDVYDVGTIIEAAQNAPGQTTGNWVKYAVQL